ncbi:MAG: hypothetical protein KA754_08005 [Corallincola sp.]|nr:hypothetical protein [Corallincola sp.]
MTTQPPPTPLWRILLVAALQASAKTLSVALGFSGALLLWFAPGWACLLLAAALALALHQRHRYK